VLGCYRSADIFILDVVEDQLEPVESVTAAHEMLHVVYARLNDDEKSRLAVLLDAQFAVVANNRILDEIDGYRQDPNSDLYNEMHSIFGTELNTLIPELQDHYQDYFSDRSKVIAESDAYELVFAELEAEIEGYDSQLAILEVQIIDLENEIDDLSQQIVNGRETLSRLEAQQEIAQYNQYVPVFNSIVNLHNAQVGVLEKAIADYNEIVKVRNDNVGAKNNLINSLDSSVQTIQ
jgi:hypothetical protein